MAIFIKEIRIFKNITVPVYMKENLLGNYLSSDFNFKPHFKSSK